MTVIAPTQITPVYLQGKKSGGLVGAELWHGIVDKNLADWEAEWIPNLQQRLKTLNQRNVERRFWPQSRHWNWRAKLTEIELRLGSLSFAIVADGMTQAMMTLDLTKRARLPCQKTQHLLYVDFLEVAPWNRNDLTGEPARYSGAGSILILAAIEQSMLEGFKGRVGLHSLPQSNRFYANNCGMEDLGQDATYDNLRYFEMTPEQAQNFIGKGRGE